MLGSGAPLSKRGAQQVAGSLLALVETDSGLSSASIKTAAAAARKLATASEGLVGADGSTCSPLASLLNSLSSLLVAAASNVQEAPAAEPLSRRKRRLEQTESTVTDIVTATSSVLFATLMGAVPGEELPGLSSACLGFASARAANIDGSSGASALQLDVSLAAGASTVQLSADALLDAQAGAVNGEAVDVYVTLWCYSPHAILQGMASASPTLSLQLGLGGTVLPNVTAPAGGGEVATFTLPRGDGGGGAECAYWDERLGALSTAGVETLAASGDSLLCRTYHLTDFSSRSRETSTQVRVSTSTVHLPLPVAHYPPPPTPLPNTLTLHAYLVSHVCWLSAVSAPLPKNLWLLLYISISRTMRRTRC
ncbi:hypothetical protein T492DRAFT_333449 [Pavlovales sp. CCMP2436]|nr:hypothetical protein T492DRAFT_333449 [Pavlovales sp. CCMP2436]